MAPKKVIPLSSAQLAVNQAIIAADNQAINLQTVTYDKAQLALQVATQKLKDQDHYRQTTKQDFINLLIHYNVKLPPYSTVSTGVDITTLSASIQQTIYAAFDKWQEVIAEQKQTGVDLVAIQAAVIAAKKTLDADKAALAADKKKNASQQPIHQNTVGAPPPLKGDPQPYKYNAPMTSSSYLKFGPQVLSAKNDKLITNPGNWTNAKSAWKPDLSGAFSGAKGTIQMSQDLASDISANTHGTGKNPATGLKNDTTPYGFKFLYNPTSVGMTWGIVESFSPQFEQSGQDIATAVGNGLLASTVTFSLILNRIEDMQHIKDSTGNFLTENTSPYPTTVDSAERGLIYDRGTMYDLEYLFRATGGYNSQYISSVGNMTTADKGWLMPMPVELHLGANLRYLVRVSTLDINHVIFNERMVPLFTTVNMTCTRYYDDLNITASNIVKATS